MRELAEEIGCSHQAIKKFEDGANSQYAGAIQFYFESQRVFFGPRESVSVGENVFLQDRRMIYALNQILQRNGITPSSDEILEFLCGGLSPTPPIDEVDFCNLVEMVQIPGGQFLMGSPEDDSNASGDERPQHLVNIRPFQMGRYPVTQKQWKAIAGLPPVNIDLDPDPSKFKGYNRPVENVSWYEAAEFCKRLSHKTEREYRLPTEAEWEYACRAGSVTAFNTGDFLKAGDAVFAVDPSLGTAAVGGGTPNSWGLYDMHGNIWEWCQDTWHYGYKRSPSDGGAWEGRGDCKVLRGGSWFAIPVHCRSASRYGISPGSRYIGSGFRLVLSAPEVIR